MKYKICLIFAMLACLGFSGCAIKNSLRPSGKNSQWNLLSKLNDRRKINRKSRHPPQTMAAIWKDSVFEKPGSASVRGFGARLFFYDEDNQAVKAEGELLVYGFDDSNEVKEDNSKADRKYVFQADKFQSHFSETDLGPSYSVWIPWEKVGGFRKTITLIPVFKTADGRVLKSGQSINVLPGRNPAKKIAKALPNKKADSKSKVSQAGFVTTASGTTSDDSSDGVQQADHTDEEVFNRVRTSTFKLTPNLASQLAIACYESVKSSQSIILENRPEQGRPRNESECSVAFDDNESQTTANPQERSEGASASADPLNGAPYLVRLDRSVDPFRVCNIVN